MIRVLHKHSTIVQSEPAKTPEQRTIDDSRYQEMIAALVDRVANVELPTRGREWSPVELGVFAGLKEAFISAGLDRVQGTLWPHAWVQLGLSFADTEQGERFQSGALLREAVEQWRAAGLVGQFWFMNKPPGMRLRFFVPDPASRVESRIISTLDHARQRGMLADYEFGVYDEETHQFGGAAGLAIFHEFSTYDSLGILRFKELRAAGDATIDETVLSLLVVNDLFAAVAGDAWEQWDIWCEMRLTGRLFERDREATDALREDLAENQELLRSLLFRRDEVIAELHPTEATLVETYAQGNRRVARALEQACRERKLSYGPRKLLPFFVVFHWNRIGLPIDEQVALCFFMHELLNPKHPRT